LRNFYSEINGVAKLTITIYFLANITKKKAYQGLNQQNRHLYPFLVN